MPSPYALDFNPLTQALESNQQYGLQKNRLAMDEKRLGFEAERLGFEREQQPYRIAGLRLGNEQTEQNIAATRLEHERNLARAFGGLARKGLLDETDAVKQQANLDLILSRPEIRSHFDKHFPKGYERNPALVGMYLTQLAEGYKDPVADEKGRIELDVMRDERDASRAFRGLRGGDTPTRTPPAAVRGAGMDTPGAREPGGTPETPMAKVANPSDEKMFIEANPGKWYARWDGTILKAPIPGPMPGRGAALPTPSAPPVVPGAVGSFARPVSMPTPVAPAVAPRVADGADEPLMNLRDELQKIQQQMRVAPRSAWPMLEKEMDRINKMIEKGVTISRSGGVVNIPGSVEAEARKSGAVEQAKQEAEARGKAIVNIPDAERALSTMLQKIYAVEKHPSLANVIGPFDRWTPTVRGDSRDVEARIGELQGATFMQAFNALRGAGQITEKEGEKATASLNRLNERGVSEAQYAQALKDFRREVIGLFNLAQQRTGATKAPPQVGEIRMGAGNVPYMYKGGPLNDPTSYEALKD